MVGSGTAILRVIFSVVTYARSPLGHVERAPVGASSAAAGRTGPEPSPADPRAGTRRASNVGVCIDIQQVAGEMTCSIVARLQGIKSIRTRLLGMVFRAALIELVASTLVHECLLWKSREPIGARRRPPARC